MDRQEAPRIELWVEVEYAQNCVWIELWAYVYVVEAGRPRPLTVKWAKMISMEIKGDRPLHDEYLELLTSDEAIAHLEEVGPELIQQMGRSLAQWELSH